MAEKQEEGQMQELNEIANAKENDYIKNDELEENKYLKTFITEWTVNSGDIIVLPIYEKQSEDRERGEIETYFNYDFTVDYGDGTVAKVNSYNDDNRKHTYLKSGTYTVKIEGLCEAFSFNTVSNSRDKITKLVQWGVIKAKHYDFAGCINLVGTIPLPSKNSFNEILSFRLLFYKCENITGNIPEDLFKYAPNTITMANTFDGAIGLSGSIPEKLFTNCTKIKSFRFTFASTNLSGNIPEKLFERNTEVINFLGTFSDNTKLKGYLPKYIFSYSDKVEHIEQTLKNSQLYINELYINSKNIVEMHDNFFTGRIEKDKVLTIYVPKNSLTEQTVRNEYGIYENVVIEVF